MESINLLTEIQKEWNNILSNIAKNNTTAKAVHILTNPRHVKAVALEGEKLTIAFRRETYITYAQEGNNFFKNKRPSAMQVEVQLITGFIPEIIYVARDQYFPEEVEAERKEKEEREKAEQEQKAIIRKERAARVIEYLKTHSGIPTIRQNEGFSNYEVRPGTEKAFAAALNYCALDPKTFKSIFEGEHSDDAVDTWDKHSFITFWGPCGSGKTRLALAIANRYCNDPEMYDVYIDVSDSWGNTGKENRGVYFYQTEELLDCLKAGFADNSYNGLLDQVKKAALLVLDDLGAEKHTEWADSKLDQIIDYRYSNGLDTVFTTNINPDKLTGRIASRLSEGVEVLVNASDYRLVIAERRSKARNNKEKKNAG